MATIKINDIMKMSSTLQTGVQRSCPQRGGRIDFQFLTVTMQQLNDKENKLFDEYLAVVSDHNLSAEEKKSKCDFIQKKLDEITLEKDMYREQYCKTTQTVLNIDYLAVGGGLLIGILGGVIVPIACAKIYANSVS